MTRKSRPTWNGKRVTKAIQFTIHRDAGICHLCSHPGANSLDHLLPVSTHPHLEWTPSNWRAAHLNSAGTPKGCAHPGCDCPGNTGRGANPIELGPSRTWTP